MKTTIFRLVMVTVMVLLAWVFLNLVGPLARNTNVWFAIAMYPLAGLAVVQAAVLLLAEERNRGKN